MPGGVQPQFQRTAIDDGCLLPAVVLKCYSDPGEVVNMAATTTNPKPSMKKVTFNHGGKILALPVLTAPVGRSSPALTAKHPQLNNPADVAIVDYYLSQLEAVRALTGSPAATEMGFARLLGAVNAVPTWTDRNAAISSLQKSFAVKDLDEVANCLIRPGGDTLKELVDNGDIAQNLLTNSAAGHRESREYIYTGHLNRGAFEQAYCREFAKAPKFNVASVPHLLKLLSMMENDPAIMDIRWMAYMLATVFIETSGTIRVPVGKHAKTKKVWRNFSPIDETLHGKGQPYSLPVKVKRGVGGTAEVTEQDGERFLVQADGTYRPIGNKLAVRGTAPSIKAGTIYLNDSGVPHSYFGRGYVQLTWWNNYASSGVLLGRGLDFLFDPNLVMEPTIAYQLMSYCMRTGAGFANGHRFSQYFFGGHTNYFGARDMVNKGGDHQEVADAALLFERVLFASKFCPTLLA
jgi:hypothetical protein